MELKKAVAECGDSLALWKISQKDGQVGSTIKYSCAIPVAETLLAALERIDLDVLDGLRTQSVCISPPSADPTTLDGRTVDGWGWKAFVTRQGLLHSEMYGKGQQVSLPENQWLDYKDWRESWSRNDYPFHVLRDERVVQKWISRPRWHGAPQLTIRRVGWRKLREPKPTNISPDFIGDIFTAEEIYILPEEGKLTVERVYPVPPPAERPPEKGDWVLGTETLRRLDPKDWSYWSKPHKITRISPEDKVAHFSSGFACRFQYLRIVRRAADPLRVGDEGLLDEKIRCWINNAFEVWRNGRPIVVFKKEHVGNTNYAQVDYAELDRSRFVLVEPVYDRPAEKTNTHYIGEKVGVHYVSDDC